MGTGLGALRLCDLDGRKGLHARGIERALHGAGGDRRWAVEGGVEVGRGGGFVHVGGGKVLGLEGNILVVRLVNFLNFPAQGFDAVQGLGGITPCLLTVVEVGGVVWVDVLGWRQSVEHRLLGHGMDIFAQTRGGDMKDGRDQWRRWVWRVLRARLR